MEAESKAAGLVSFYEVLREMAPPDRVALLLRELPPETAQVLESPPFATTWLPLYHFMRILEVAQRVVFDGSDQPLFELGRKQIPRDLSSVYRLLIRMVTTPHGMADRAARIWSTYMRNAGEIRVLDRKPRSIEAEYGEVPHAVPPFWTFINGSIVGTLELTGVRGLEVRIISGGGRELRCRFRATWR